MKSPSRRERHHYAAHNPNVNTEIEFGGYTIGWTICRFRSGADRDAFVAAKESQKQAVEAVTRREAEFIWRREYRQRGEPLPLGGLFGRFPGDDDYHIWEAIYDFDGEGERRIEDRRFMMIAKGKAIFVGR